jgi:hypothetical protein
MAFARSGANVVLNGFGEATQIEKTRSDLAHRTNAKIVYSPADMSKPKAIGQMIRQPAMAAANCPVPAPRSSTGDPPPSPTGTQGSTACRQASIPSPGRTRPRT